MVPNYVRRDVDTVSESQIKLPRAGVQTSYVHSSINMSGSRVDRTIGVACGGAS